MLMMNIKLSSLRQAIQNVYVCVLYKFGGLSHHTDQIKSLVCAEGQSRQSAVYHLHTVRCSSWFMYSKRAMTGQLLKGLGHRSGESFVKSDVLTVSTWKLSINNRTPVLKTLLWHLRSPDKKCYQVALWEE